MNTNKAIFIALVLFSPATALAASPKFTCTSAQELDKKSEDCGDNHRYTKAGKSCLKKLEAVISGAAKVSPNQLKKRAEEALEKEKIEASGKTYELSGSKKEEILASAKIAKENLSAYRDNIFYPEDWDAPKELIGDIEEFLDSQSCYADARDELEEIEDTIDFYIAEFGK